MFSQENRTRQAFTFNLLSKPDFFYLAYLDDSSCLLYAHNFGVVSCTSASWSSHSHTHTDTDTHTHTHGQCLLPCLSKCPGAETPKIFLTKLVKPGLVLEYSHLGDKALALGSLLQIFSDMWKLSQGCIKAKIDRKTDFLLPFPAILLRSPELEKYGEKSNTLFSESG